MKTLRDKHGRFVKGSNGHLGYKHSEKTKRKISQSKKGKAIGLHNPRWNPNRHNAEQVECACGCGTLIQRYDYRGRIHKWAMGHQLRGKPRLDNGARLRECWRNGKWKPRGGEQHWNWKGGITPLIRLLRHTPEYKEWRLKVYERDNWTCRKCGKHCGEKNIVAHHRQSFEEYPELRYEVDNGITLCRKCHLKLHRETE